MNPSNQSRYKRHYPRGPLGSDCHLMCSTMVGLLVAISHPVVGAVPVYSRISDCTDSSLRGFSWAGIVCTERRFPPTFPRSQWQIDLREQNPPRMLKLKSDMILYLTEEGD